MSCGWAPIPAAQALMTDRDASIAQVAEWVSMAVNTGHITGGARGQFDRIDSAGMRGLLVQACEADLVEGCGTARSIIDWLRSVLMTTIQVRDLTAARDLVAGK